MIVNVVMNKERQANALLNEREIAAGSLRLCSFPRIVFVELTRNCNLHCPMCRSKEAPSTEKNMPYNLFESISRTMFPYAEIVDLRGNGESLLYPDFIRALEYASSFGCQLKIYTNLSIDNPEVVGSLMKFRVITAVSFDAAQKEVFEIIRSGSSFERVLDNLRRIVYLRDNLGLPSEIVYLSVVVQPGNVNQLAEIVVLAAKIGITLVRFFPVNPHERLNGFSGQLLDSLKECLVLAKEYKVVVELGASLHPDFVLADKLFGCCLHPWIECCFLYDGRLSFCDQSMGNIEYEFGVWKENNFLELWNGPRMRKIREGHLSLRGKHKNKFFECGWCYSNRYSDVEHWIRPKAQERLVSTRKGIIFSE